jgi:hypothetical protein
MRITWSVIIVLALAGLAPGSAVAQGANKTASNYHYETCTCRFGYGSVCVAAVSCDSGGGGCSGSCTPPPYAALTNR